MAPSGTTPQREYVLITGGSGFIGSTLVRQWLEHESEAVVNFDKLTYAGLKLSLADIEGNLQYHFVQGDVADPVAVSETISKYRPTKIIHLAAESHVDRSIAEPPLFASTNVLGTCVLLDATLRYWQSLPSDCRDVFRFVLISTDEVFGSAEPGEVFTAESPVNPSSPYSASKAAAEQFVRSFAHTYGLPTVIVNPTNNYGPRQLPEKLIPKMILAAHRGEPFTVYSNGLHERDWLHVDDCCRGIRAVVRRGIPDRRYLLGSGRCLTNMEVVESIREIVAKLDPSKDTALSEIQHVNDRPGHDLRYAVGEAAEELLWRPETAFPEGLSRTVAWYLSNDRWVAAATISLQTASTGQS